MSLRIAIPTDFSSNSLKAAQYVLQLFRDEKVVFFLVHTYTPSVYRSEYLIHSPGQIGLGDFYRERAMRKLKKFQKKLQDHIAPRHEFILHAAFNVLDAELNEMAEKEALDLIAMGTQGATGAKEILFGSHAVQVLHRAGCPVLVIPAEAGAGAIRDVLFPTDYAPDYAHLKLKVLETILAGKDRKLHLLHVHSHYDDQAAQQHARDSLLNRLEPLAPQLTEVPEQGIIEAINGFAQQQPIQMLVMVRNRHSFLERLLVTPIIDRIGFHAMVPFMVIPPVPEAAAT